MNNLTLELETGSGVRALNFSVRRMINLGYSGRVRSVVDAHIEELRHLGVPPPPQVPYCIPVAARQLTQDDRLEVLPGKTSGEAEVVFFLQKDEIYVGVGSDHTDRDLEVLSIDKSKQVYPNVVSRCVWRYADVQAHWDQLVLSSTVTSEDAVPRQYQRARLSAILPPEAIFEEVRRGSDEGDSDGLVIFSGTIPLQGKPEFGAARFMCELIDEVRDRRLSASYDIQVLGGSTRAATVALTAGRA